MRRIVPLFERIPGRALCAVLVCLTVCFAAGAAERVKIGVSVPASDYGWTGGVEWWARKAVGELGARYPEAEFLLKTAPDADAQAGDIDALKAWGMDSLVILPHDPAKLAPALNSIRESGVYTVIVDRSVPELGNDAYVAGDNYGLGRVCGEFLAEEFADRDAEIVVMTGIPCDVDTQRVNAFRSVMRAHRNIKILETQPAYWSTEKGAEIMAYYLEKYPDIDGVWCQDDDVLEGVVRAYRESGRTDVRFILGGAGSKNAIKMVMDGDPLVRGTVTYPTSMIYEGVQVAAEHMVRGRSRGKAVILPAELVTAENAASFYNPDSPW